MMKEHRNVDSVLIGMTGQFAAKQGLSVRVYNDDTRKTMNEDARMSAHDETRVSLVAIERGTNATGGEEKGGAFGEALAHSVWG